MNPRLHDREFLMSRRSRSVRTLASTAIAALILTACGGTDVGTQAPEASPSASSSQDVASPSAGSSTAEPTAEPTTSAPAAPAAPVHPVAAATATMPDGTVISAADFAGETIFVETFATWCSTCRRQLADTQAAAVAAGDSAVFLVLSVETDLDPARLTQYAADNGFDDLTFAVLSDVGLAALNDEFGPVVLNAPSTPKFVINADGELSALTTGRESSEEILAQLQSA